MVSPAAQTGADMNFATENISANPGTLEVDVRQKMLKTS
jgi:hypothetical protein